MPTRPGLKPGTSKDTSRFVVGALLALAGLVTGPTVAAQTTPATGVIAGKVLDVQGQPVPDVAIELRVTRQAAAPPPSSASPRPPVTSDSQGQFQFTGLPSGMYTLRVRQDGYAHVRGATVALNDAQLVTGVTLRAGRHGSISGTVRNDNGDPIVGAGISALNRRMVGFRSMLFHRGAGITDDRGQYRVADLPPGDYLICACRVDSPRAAKDAKVFAPTFYPGSTSVANALSIDVAYSDDRSGMDITMTPVRPSRVAGKLLGGGPDLNTTHNLLMLLEDDDPAAVGIAGSKPVVLTADGVFEFVGVTPGRYTLQAFPANGKGLRASQNVVVGERDVTGLEMQLGPGATVRGRIDFSGGAARPDAGTLEKSSITLVPILLTPTQLIGIGQSGSVVYRSWLARDGALTIENLPPGQYLVIATVPGSVWNTVESVSSSGVRSFEPILDVPPDGSDTLVVTLSDDALAILEARLALGAYEVPSETRVAVFPVDRTFWDETYKAPGRFAATMASVGGIVGFPNLPAGDYYVLELAPEDGLLSAQRMVEWAKRATTVRLRAGEKTTVTLKRTPGGPGL